MYALDVNILVAQLEEILSGRSCTGAQLCRVCDADVLACCTKFAMNILKSDSRAAERPPHPVQLNVEELYEVMFPPIDKT